MKVCPKCNKSYDDANLNFCLEDGEMLMETETIDAPPTIMLDAPRQTKENWGDFDNGINDPARQNQPNQQMYQPPFATPQGTYNNTAKDQTLPIVSLISGVMSIFLSFCCYLGVIIGPLALITGYMGMNNVNKNPDQYDGKTFAIIGMITGGLGLAISLFMLIFFFLLNLFQNI